MMLKFRSFVLCYTVMCCFSLSVLASLHQSGFYLGTSFGVSQLLGKRTDSISDGTTTLTIFNDKKMSDTSLEGNLFTGYRYSPAHTNFTLSIEGLFNFSPFESRVYRNLGEADDQAVQFAILKRSWGYGMTSRIGYIVSPSAMPYLLLGIKRDQFTYESIGSDATSAFKRKFLTGFDLGGGIETCIKGVKTGLEFKYTHYNQAIFEPRDQAGHTAQIRTNPKTISISLRFTHIF